MLKLEKNVTPTGTINGVNKVFTLPSFIGYIESVTVDGADIGTAYTFTLDKITLTSAPSTSITVSFFSREQRDILGNGEVTMGDLIDEVYDEIGRKATNRIYTPDRIRRELNETIGMIIDDVPERSQIQHYSYKEINGIKINRTDNTSAITVEASYPLDIEGSFLVGDGIYMNYYDYDGTIFDVVEDELIEETEDEKAIVGHRLPYGVERVSKVYVNGLEYEYVDNREFYMDTAYKFTIMKDYQGNEYLYLPYSEKEVTVVVKFVPDYAIATTDEDILDIPYKYKRAFTYDVAYRILASREDERWQYYERQAQLMSRKYKRFKANTTRKTRSKIGFAPVFNERDVRRQSEILPEGVYDDYT